mmetsp:Transcript_137180/g.438680  ORF Transcript_137180/g.438680 Transcript_137180/m.438680 type:complete len:275 (+) Transcript_137180:2-826(+)
MCFSSVPFAHAAGPVATMARAASATSASVSSTAVAAAAVSVVVGGDASVSGWRRPQTLVAAGVTLAIAAAAAVAIRHRWALRQRRASESDAGSTSGSGAATPTMGAEPPAAGPERAPAVAAGGPRKQDPLLEEGLRALGMLSGSDGGGGSASATPAPARRPPSAVATTAAAAPAPARRPPAAVATTAGAAASAAAAAKAVRQRSQATALAATMHSFEEGIDGADDTVVIERVSQEEEERRYFANLGGADCFAGLDAPEPEAAPAARRAPVVGYD